MKTKFEWDEISMDLSDFLCVGDEIDEDLYRYLAESVPPQYCSREFVQCGEAEHKEDETYFYMTAAFDEGRNKYFYLGVLPEFKY